MEEGVGGSVYLARGESGTKSLAVGCVRSLTGLASVLDRGSAPGVSLSCLLCGRWVIDSFFVPGAQWGISRPPRFRFWGMCVNGVGTQAEGRVAGCHWVWREPQGDRKCTPSIWGRQGRKRKLTGGLKDEQKVAKSSL